MAVRPDDDTAPPEPAPEQAQDGDEDKTSLMGKAQTDAWSPGPSRPLTGRARYRVLGELGAGGCGVVERQYDRALNRVVAAKSPISPEDFIEQALIREARLLAYLDHPGVVQVYDLLENESGISYTMELIEGECLCDRLQSLRASGRTMPLSETLRIVTRVCETLANAHDKGIVHLDIKPANIMLQRYGHVSVIDWGIARFFNITPYRSHLEHTGTQYRDKLTTTNVHGGTPLYMPPEQFAGDTVLGPPADVYAVGTMLFEMLSGQLPFPAQDVNKLRERKLAGPPPLRTLRPEISDRLAAICLRMLAPAPGDRPQSLEAVLEELAALTDIGHGAEIVTLAAGEVLFEQGAVSTTAHQIIDGQLEIVVVCDGGPRVVATREAGEIIGELAMLSRARRSATVRASRPTTLRAIDWKAIEDELSKVDPLIAHLLRNLSDKLIETTQG